VLRSWQGLQRLRSLFAASHKPTMELAAGPARMSALERENQALRDQIRDLQVLLQVKDTEISLKYHLLQSKDQENMQARSRIGWLEAVASERQRLRAEAGLAAATPHAADLSVFGSLDASLAAAVAGQQHQQLSLRPSCPPSAAPPGAAADAAAVGSSRASAGSGAFGREFLMRFRSLDDGKPCEWRLGCAEKASLAGMFGAEDDDAAAPPTPSARKGKQPKTPTGGRGAPSSPRASPMASGAAQAAHAQAQTPKSGRAGHGEVRSAVKEEAAPSPSPLLASPESQTSSPQRAKKPPQLVLDEAIPQDEGSAATPSRSGPPAEPPPAKPPCEGGSGGSTSPSQGPSESPKQTPMTPSKRLAIVDPITGKQIEVKPSPEGSRCKPTLISLEAIAEGRSPMTPAGSQRPGPPGSMIGMHPPVGTPTALTLTPTAGLVPLTLPPAISPLGAQPGFGAPGLPPRGALVSPPLCPPGSLAALGGVPPPLPGCLFPGSQAPGTPHASWPGLPLPGGAPPCPPPLHPAPTPVSLEGMVAPPSSGSLPMSLDALVGATLLAPAPEGQQQRSLVDLVGPMSTPGGLSADLSLSSGSVPGPPPALLGQQLTSGPPPHGMGSLPLGPLPTAGPMPSGLGPPPSLGPLSTTPSGGGGPPGCHTLGLLGLVPPGPPGRPPHPGSAAPRGLLPPGSSPPPVGVLPPHLAAPGGPGGYPGGYGMFGPASFEIPGESPSIALGLAGPPPLGLLPPGVHHHQQPPVSAINLPPAIAGPSLLGVAGYGPPQLLPVGGPGGAWAGGLSVISPPPQSAPLMSAPPHTQASH